MPVGSPAVGRSAALCRRVVALAAAALAVLVLAVAAPAQAHTDLVGSTPGPDDTVAVDTDRLVLVFGGRLADGAGEVVVLDDHGVDAVDGPAAVSGQTLEVPLRLHRAGLHEVTYRVVSDDGHAVVGAYEFSVRTGKAGEALPEIVEGAAPAAPTTPGLTPLVWVAGVAVLLLGLVLVRSGSRSAQGRTATLVRSESRHIGEDAPRRPGRG